MPPRRKKPANASIVKSNVQTVVVKVGDSKKKRRAPRRRRPPAESDSIPMRQLPPVVYQVPAQTTGYVNQPPIMRPEPAPVSITQREPPRVSAPILQDIGVVGTEGRGVEIIDVPTKKEQLSELVEPVPKQKKARKVREVPSAKSETFQFSDVYSESNPLIKQAFGKANVLPTTAEQPFLPPSNEKEEVLPLTAPNYSRDAPSVAPVIKARKPPRTQQQVRDDLEAEYQALTGLPVKPIISNKELKALVYAEKKRQKTKKGISRIMGREV